MLPPTPARGSSRPLATARSTGSGAIRRSPRRPTCSRCPTPWRMSWTRPRSPTRLMPDEPEAHGLLALMLLNDARRDARFANGSVVLLRDQDRSLWDENQIAEGRRTLDRAVALCGRGQYTLQAAIAATEESQDWSQIAGLYRELARLTGSPVVELNRAIAIGEAGDVEAALALIDPLELDRYRPFGPRAAAARAAAGRDSGAVARQRLEQLEHLLGPGQGLRLGLELAGHGVGATASRSAGPGRKRRSPGSLRAWAGSRCRRP
jgi:hypothetical protein